MAPMLLPGEVLLVNESYDFSRLKVGDIVGVRNLKSMSAISHRVISRKPFILKGDRNLVSDPIDADWKFEGKAEKVYKKRKWKKLRFGILYALLSKYNVFPRQN